MGESDPSEMPSKFRGGDADLSGGVCLELRVGKHTSVLGGSAIREAACGSGHRGLVPASSLQCLCPFAAGRKGAKGKGADRSSATGEPAEMMSRFGTGPAPGAELMGVWDGAGSRVGQVCRQHTAA